MENALEKEGQQLEEQGSQELNRKERLEREESEKEVQQLKSSNKRDRQETKGSFSDSSPEDHVKRDRKSAPEGPTMDKILEKISALTEKMSEMQGDIKVIRSEAERRNNDFMELKNLFTEDREKREKEMAEMKDEMGGVKQSVNSVRDELQELRAENSAMKARIANIDRESKRCNIVVAGIDFQTPKEGYEELQKLVSEATNNAVSVSGIRTFETREKKKLIVASCRSLDEKMLLLAKKKSLQHRVGDKTVPVYVNSDLSKEDRDAQREMRVIAKQKRDQGATVKIAGNRMKINDGWYQWNPKLNLLQTSEDRNKDFRNKANILERAGAPKEV